MHKYTVFNNSMLNRCVILYISVNYKCVSELCKKDFYVFNNLHLLFIHQFSKYLYVYDKLSFRPSGMDN